MGLSIALVERLPGWPLGLHPFAADFVIKAIGSLALAASFEGMVLDGFVPLLPPSFGRNLLQFCIAQDKFFLAKMMMSHSQCQGSSAGSPLFPRAFEPRVLHIFICSHLHHIFITSSSHLHHIFITSSSHLVIFTSSLSLSLCLFLSLLIFTSSHLHHIFTSCRRGATKWQSFRTKWSSSVNNWGFYARFVKLRFWSVRGNHFARNEVRVSKTEGLFWVWLVLLKGLCVKVSVCKGFCVQKRVCV